MAIAPAQAICIYRFVQEGLMNALRHAGGAGQTVGWRVSECLLAVTVSDTGSGFRVGDLEQSDRLGLRALRDRVESVGGAFAIDGRPGGGSALTVQLGLEEET